MDGAARRREAREVARGLLEDELPLERRLLKAGGLSPADQAPRVDIHAGPELGVEGVLSLARLVELRLPAPLA